MIQNYLKVAFRSILRNKLTSFINIFGLALAMTCCLMIYLFIRDEVSYDRYNGNADRMFRVTRNFLSPDGSVNLHLGHVAPPFGPLLKNDFPEFKEVARTLQTSILVSREEDGRQVKAFNERNTFFAEPEILKIFTIPVTEGNPEKSLQDSFTIMLSETTAKRFFGNESAIGKTLRASNNFDLTVTGIFKDFPEQAHWHPDLFVSFSTLNDSTVYGRRGLETNWGNNAFCTYILAEENFNPEAIEKRFPAFLDKHMGAAMAGDHVMPSSWTNLFLQKVTDIHLHSHLDSEVESNGNIRSVYMMGVIGFFIILIACFNFINLSTARATKRAKEVGLRKVVGAFRTQLINQYLSESMLIAMFALVIAVALCFASIHWLNNFTSKTIEIDPIGNWPLFLGMVVIALLVGALAGIYPAFVVSGFKPALILKGQQGNIKGKAGLRKILVVSQFSISVVLIIATMITYQQLSFMNNKDLGYNKNQVVTISHFSELSSTYDAFYNELLKQSSIKSVSRSSRTPTGRLLDSQGSAQVQKDDSLSNTNVVLKNIRIDEEFFNTYEVQFISGRNFSKEVQSDDSLAFILNESAVKMVGLSPEEILTRDFQYAGTRGRVIGVVKDFHFESLHEPIVPMVFHQGDGFGSISIKLAGNNMQEGLRHIERVWRDFMPQRPFEYRFLSMQYEQLYNNEQRQGQLFTVFAGLAILIACLGLFGLATFNTLQRVKEIGIRKVLGASVFSIVQLLSREIIVLILVANVIAWPLAWYFMDQWLDSFAYRININIWLYALAAFAALMIALITVSTQTIRAARSNPANTLRYE